MDAPGEQLFADIALLPDGWARDVGCDIDGAGRLTKIDKGVERRGKRVGILLAAPTNLHSHAFQRAMAGMTERRGARERDSFWTWRQTMYRFLDVLSPDDVESIAALAQVEMLEAGYAAVAEFHYLHHLPGGAEYASVAEMSERIASAASATGIGLSLLPVLYQFGGCDRRPLAPEQRRFGNTPDTYARLYAAARTVMSQLPPDAVIGAAPHSLRAVDAHGLQAAVKISDGAPLHIHIAEQAAEVEEVLTAKGQRPVEWLLGQHDVSANWCLVHATHMTRDETTALADSGAVVGLCPITEANLGDGIFDATTYAAADGRFGVGSDSNVRISLTEELRTLEYAQRLRTMRRSVMATAERSTGRMLFDAVVAGGAQAAGRNAGALEVGRWADLLALNADALTLEGREGDELLDAYVFTGDDRLVTDVWAAGRHLVVDGRHRAGDAIRERYRRTMNALRTRW